MRFKRTAVEDLPEAPVTDWTQDPRLRTAQERRHRCDIAVAQATERLRRLRSALHQVNETIASVGVTVLVGNATDDDVKRLRAQRSQIEVDVDEAQRVLELVEEQRAEHVRAEHALEGHLRRDAARAAAIACRPVVEEMSRLLRRLSALNSELDATRVGVGAEPPIPSPLMNLEISEGSGVLWHWLREADRFIDAE